MTSGRKAFVTGGTGFVGSHLVESLLGSGFAEVRCLVRAAPRWLEGLDVVPIKGDLSNGEALRRGCDGVDYVYHVAAVTGTKRRTTWDEFRAENVEGTLRLLDAVEAAAPGIRRVELTSSLAAVGRCASGVAREEDPLRPVSMYGRSKAEMEAAVQAYAGRLPLVIVRPPSVYGPREEDIYTFFRTVSRGLCPIVGDGKAPALSLVHVRDLVRGMRLAAESDAPSGRVYFVGSEAQYAWHEVRDATAAALGRSVLTIPVPERLLGPIGAVAEMVGRITGRFAPLNREKAREIRIACKQCDVSRARSEIGYRQQIALDEGIHETIAWYRLAGWLR